MPKKTLLLWAIALVGLQCFAHDKGPDGKRGGENSPGWCRLDLSEEQQSKMHSEKYKFEESKVDLEAQLKHARLAYQKALTDPRADYDGAKSAAKELASAMGKLIVAKETFKADVAFKIFTADQRKEWEKCHRGGRWRHSRSGRRGGERAEMDEEDSAPSDRETVAILEGEEDSAGPEIF